MPLYQNYHIPIYTVWNQDLNHFHVEKTEKFSTKAVYQILTPFSKIQKSKVLAGYIW